MFPQQKAPSVGERTENQADTGPFLFSSQQSIVIRKLLDIITVTSDEQIML